MALYTNATDGGDRISEHRHELILFVDAQYLVDVRELINKFHDIQS